MIYLILVLTFILGYSLLNLIGGQINILEKLGLSTILGIGIHSVMMFVLNILSIPINETSIIIYTILLTTLFNIKTFKEPKASTIIQLYKGAPLKISLGWLFFAGLTVYLLYGIGLKCLYWPVAEYDSLTGYDLQGKMIAAEGTLKTSIFSYPFANTYSIARFIYPPLTSCTFAIAYIFGAANSKIIILLLFISFIVAFYGILRKYVNDIWAIAITFFMMITPEMFSHASLALTNLPNAIYTSLSFLLLYSWLKTRNTAYFIVSLLLTIFSLWSRSDSIVFLAGYALVFVTDYFNTRQWKLPLIYLSLAVIPFIVWSVYIKINVQGANSSDFFIKSLFWDWEKFSYIFGKGLGLMLATGQLYGVTFYLFVVLLAINIIDIIESKNSLIIFILSTWFLYTFLYYQMDYNFAGSVDAYLNASYKRGLFNFIPLAWFFIATSPLTTKAIQKADNWIFKKGKTE